MMSEEEIKEWFFDKYESETPPEEWDVLDIWEVVCKYEIDNSIRAHIVLSDLIENNII